MEIFLNHIRVINDFWDVVSVSVEREDIRAAFDFYFLV